MSSLNAGAPEACDDRERESYTGPVRPDSPGRRPCRPRYALPFLRSEAHATVNATAGVLLCLAHRLRFAVLLRTASSIRRLASGSTNTFPACC